MSILIKGMKMPKNCGECPMGSVFAGYKCLAKNKQFDRYAFNSIQDFCPLIELPPHGRLIDADNIGLTNFEIILCQKGNPFKNALEMLLEKIENAPTIIPAEEGET